MKTFISATIFCAIALTANPIGIQQSLSLLGPVAVAGGGGTPTFIQDDGDIFDPFGTARSVTFGSDTTTGNCIVAIYRGTNPGTLVVTDNKGNSYTLHVDGTTGGTAVAVAPNITGGASHQVTFTVSSSGDPGRMIIMEFSNIATSSPVDDTEVVVDFIANVSTSLTTTVNNTMLLGILFSAAGGATEGSGFTLRHDQSNLQTETKVGVSSGANTVNFSHSERSVVLVAVALKPN